MLWRRQRAASKPRKERRDGKGDRGSDARAWREGRGERETHHRFLIMHTPTRRRLAIAGAYAALVVCCLHIGASFYEHVVINTAWTYNPLVIESEQSGVDRSLFWVPIQVCAALSLTVALFAGWYDRTARRWLLFAALSYVAACLWMFVCWVPVRAVVEKRSELLLAELQSARIWLMASVLSTVLVLVSTWTLYHAALRLESPAAGGSRRKLRPLGVAFR
jgi:hypothetical protein